MTVRSSIAQHRAGLALSALPAIRLLRICRIARYALATTLFLTASQVLTQTPSTPTSEAAAPAPAERPPTPPAVTCAANSLGINASNATFAAVMQAVQTCLGITIDVPGPLAEERTFFNAATGTPRAVLDAFLQQMPVNFIIDSVPGNTEKIRAVILIARTRDTDSKTERTEATDTDLSSSPNHRAWLASRDAARPMPAENLAATPTPADSPSAEAPITTVSNTPPEATPSTAAPANNAPQNELQNRIKSMEQLFEQRKNMPPPSAQP